jgi:hypothetical protein
MSHRSSSISPSSLPRSCPSLILNATLAVLLTARVATPTTKTIAVYPADNNSLFVTAPIIPMAMGIGSF